MKKIKLINIIILVIATLLLMACNAKKSAVIQPEKNLSIVTGTPETIEYTFDNGEKYLQEVIEIYGYRMNPVERLPKLPRLSETDKNEKTVKMSKDSIEIYTPLLPGNYYSIIISNGPNYLCTLYDSEGNIIHPLKNFQLMNPYKENFMASYICNITRKKDIETESITIGLEDFKYLQKTKLCSLCYIELDKKNKIVSSGKVIFPAFGAIGNVIQKKADPKTTKIYVKIVYEGIFGVSIKPCEEMINLFTI